MSMIPHKPVRARISTVGRRIRDLHAGTGGLGSLQAEQINEIREKVKNMLTQRIQSLSERLKKTKEHIEMAKKHTACFKESYQKRLLGGDLFEREPNTDKGK